MMTTTENNSLYSALNPAFDLENNFSVKAKKDKQSLDFLYSLKEAFEHGRYPSNGQYLILEDVLGHFVNENNVYFDLHLITKNHEFAQKMSILYDNFYKLNPFFIRCALRYIDEAIKEATK